MSSAASDALHLGRNVRARFEVNERLSAQAEAHFLLLVARVDSRKNLESVEIEFEYTVDLREDAQAERLAVLGAFADEVSGATSLFGEERTHVAYPTTTTGNHNPLPSLRLGGEQSRVHRGSTAHLSCEARQWRASESAGRRLTDGTS